MVTSWKELALLTIRKTILSQLSKDEQEVIEELISLLEKEIQPPTALLNLDLFKGPIVETVPVAPEERKCVNCDAPAYTYGKTRKFFSKYCKTCFDARLKSPPVPKKLDRDVEGCYEAIQNHRYTKKGLKMTGYMQKNLSLQFGLSSSQVAELVSKAVAQATKKCINCGDTAYTNEGVRGTRRTYSSKYCASCLNTIKSGSRPHSIAAN